MHEKLASSSADDELARGEPSEELIRLYEVWGRGQIGTNDIGPRCDSRVELWSASDEQAQSVGALRSELYAAFWTDLQSSAADEEILAKHVQKVAKDKSMPRIHEAPVVGLGSVQRTSTWPWQTSRTERS